MRCEILRKQVILIAEMLFSCGMFMMKVGKKRMIYIIYYNIKIENSISLLKISYFGGKDQVSQK